MYVADPGLLVMKMDLGTSVPSAPQESISTRLLVHHNLGMRLQSWPNNRLIVKFEKESNTSEFDRIIKSTSIKSNAVLSEGYEEVMMVAR